MKRFGWLLGLDSALTVLTAALAAALVEAWEHTTIAAAIDAVITAAVNALPTTLMWFF